MKSGIFLIGVISIIFLSGCGAQSANNSEITENDGSGNPLGTRFQEIPNQNETRILDTPKALITTPTEILERKQIPVLCYHQIRDWKDSDSKTAKDFITPIAIFEDQIK